MTRWQDDLIHTNIHEMRMILLTVFVTILACTSTFAESAAHQAAPTPIVGFTADPAIRLFGDTHYNLSHLGQIRVALHRFLRVVLQGSRDVAKRATHPQRCDGMEMGQY